MFFLRYTTTAIEDLKRNASFHASGISESDSTIEKMASAFECDEEDVVLLDNGIYANGKENGDTCFFHKLPGLCGFELEADTLVDAIEEANGFHFNEVYNSNSMGDMIVIFEGEYLEGNMEGCLFSAKKILFTK